MAQRPIVHVQTVRIPSVHPSLRPVRFALGLLCSVGVLAAAPPAHSHAIESSLERLSALNDKLLLESRFGNGEPASDAVVRLVPPGGQPVEVGRTDGQGRLSFTLPSQASADWEVQVDGGPGHRDYLELPAGSGPAARVQGEPRPPLLAGRSPLAAVGLLGLGGLSLGSLQLLRRRQQRDRPSPTGSPR
jgi:nickel transport protein